MSKRVLDVGQCNPDHASLTRFLTGHFDVEIERTALADETLERLRNEAFDLVLINRKLDADYSDGMEILRSIKQDEKLKSLPVILVSNYADAQAAAIAAGAEPGFGKAELSDPATVEKVAAVLGAEAKLSAGR